MRALAARVAAMLCLLAAAGCTSATQRFPGADAAQVWTAMVKVAEDPEYPDWKIASNDVWLDEAARRIEVYRRLHRVLFTPQHDPRGEQRTWRFEMRLKESDPPEVKFISRGLALPAHARLEADHYFTEVAAALASGVGEPSAASGDDNLLDALGLDDDGP